MAGSITIFSIEKKEDDKWSPVKEIGDRTTDTETYIFQGERDLNINWSEIYGSLFGGEYRVVKFFLSIDRRWLLWYRRWFYLFAEFSIEDNKYEFYRGAATSVGAVNGRDKRRAQRAAIDCPGMGSCAVTKTGKAKGTCPPPLT